MEGAYGYAVLAERLRATRPDGDAQHVDAVGHGVVDGGEHVLFEASVAFFLAAARDGPAHFVDGQAGQGRASGRGAGGEAAQGGDVVDSPPGGRG